MRQYQAIPKCAEDRPVHTQDLEVFKADMTSMLADILKSSLTNFASHLKSSSGGQGDSESAQDVTSDQEKDPSDQDDHLEGRDLASVEDPAGFLGDPKLESLMMSEEEERDFETFTLACQNVLKSMTSWRGSQENTKVYSLAQQVHRQDDSFTCQVRL